MDIDSNTSNDEQAWVPTPVSLRKDQRDWLDAEKVRQRHGNRSRIVQDALDLYRETQEAQKQQLQGAA